MSVTNKGIKLRAPEYIWFLKDEKVKYQYALKIDAKYRNGQCDMLGLSMQKIGPSTFLRVRYHDHDTFDLVDLDFEENELRDLILLTNYQKQVSRDHYKKWFPLVVTVSFRLNCQQEWIKMKPMRVRLNAGTFRAVAFSAPVARYITGEPLRSLTTPCLCAAGIKREVMVVGASKALYSTPRAVCPMICGGNCSFLQKNLVIKCLVSKLC
jgi:hypothetical protein